MALRFSSNQRRVTKRRRLFSVDPYDAALGCLATRFNGEWVVTCPDGRISSRHGDDETAARNQAQYLNLTADDTERERWAAR